MVISRVLSRDLLELRSFWIGLVEVLIVVAELALGTRVGREVGSVDVGLGVMAVVGIVEDLAGAVAGLVELDLDLRSVGFHRL